MKGYKKESKLKVKAAMIVAGMILAGSTSVYALTVSPAENSAGGYDAAYVQDVENVRGTELAEYVQEYNVEGLTVLEGAVADKMRSSVKTFDWEVPSKHMVQSGWFRAEAGQKISVAAVVSPSNVTVKVGIVEPSRVQRYVSVTSSASHDFVLDQTGSYRIFVENKTDKDAFVGGSYIVQ